MQEGCAYCGQHTATCTAQQTVFEVVSNLFYEDEDEDEGEDEGEEPREVPEELDDGGTAVPDMEGGGRCSSGCVGLVFSVQATPALSPRPAPTFQAHRGSGGGWTARAVGAARGSRRRSWTKSRLR